MVEKYYSDGWVDIYCADAIEALKALPSESVQMAITSPPYYGLRNYPGPNQIGLEPTPEEYVARLMEVFREVKRVLRKDGSFYLNIGDTYAGSWGHYAHEKNPGLHDHQNYPTNEPPPSARVRMRPKCMICIPERVLFAMLEEGWILRNKIIWHKPNSMPSSKKDAFTPTWEYLYFFTKNDKTILWRNEETGEWRDTEPSKEEKYPWGGRYYNPETGEYRWEKPENMDGWEHLTPIWHGFDYFFDLDSIRELPKTSSINRAGPSGIVPFNLRVRDVKRGKGGAYVESGKVKELKASGEEIEKYQYPEGRAGSRPLVALHHRYRGDGWEQQAIEGREKKLTKHDIAVDRIGNFAYSDPLHVKEYHPQGKNPGDMWSIPTKPFPECHFAVYPEELCIKPILASSRPGDIVLDPLAGSGTTGVVAKKLGRKAVLIDIVESYCEIARRRIMEVPIPLQFGGGK